MFELAPLRRSSSIDEIFPMLVVAGRETVPVNVGEASGAFRSRAVCVAVEIGLDKSEVSLTFVKPTIAFVIPFTVPVNVGEAIGAFKSICA